MIKVLLVEDDTRLAEHISKLILTEGLVPLHVSSREETDAVLSSDEKINAVILDRLLGSFDTKDKMADIKRKWPEAPIIILSAINTPMERADLINLGADDYLGKPFVSQELLARIKAVSRRYSSQNQKYRYIGNTILDMEKKIFLVGDRHQTLMSKEYLIFKILSDDVGKVLSRDQLIDAVWGANTETDTNVVKSTMANLRRRLTEMGSNVEIKNMRNNGYWIEE